MKKQMFVRSEVQIQLMKNILIPEMNHGFWADHRPAGHGQCWLDVEFLVTSNDQVGPSGFTPPRNYNFANVEFLETHLDKMWEEAKKVDPNITLKLTKRLINELSKIVGGRLTDLTEKAEKANRGSHAQVTRIDDGVKVLTNGKGLGNEHWLPITKELIEVLESADVECEETRTELLIKKTTREARVYVNGANTLAVEYVGLGGGGCIAICEEDGDHKEMIRRVVLEMTSMNPRRTSPAIPRTTKNASAPTITVVQSKDGSIVRRAPVLREMPTAETMALVSPFNP